MRVSSPRYELREKGRSGPAAGVPATRRAFRPGPRASRALGLLLAGLAGAALACGAGGEGSVADTGGMSGTGISQGPITAFGSIFVNGVEWDLSEATVVVNDAPTTESELRLGMVVRVEGSFDDDGASGRALSVAFDAELEGPIEADPVEVMPGGLEKTFSVLGRTVSIHETDTTFDGGASFDTLARDDVVEVSGFVDPSGTIRATRIELEGSFPTISEVELRGRVENLTVNGAAGEFDLGPILIHFDASTTFSETAPESLSEGDLVEVEGLLRITGDEIDAVEIELESEGFDEDDFERVELEGFVSGFVSDGDFRVAGIPTDASNALFDPAGSVLADGLLVEVDGRLENGVLIASRVEIEDDDDDDDGENVEIEAAVTQVDPVARRLTILGITVEADGDTQLEDDRDEDPNFRFDEIQPGDWLEIQAVETGTASARALSIERDDLGDDVVLGGPVTMLDPVLPAISILGRDVPLGPGTLFFDDTGAPRSQEAFFMLVLPGDVVRARDPLVLPGDDPGLLLEAGEVELSSD